MFKIIALVALCVVYAECQNFIQCNDVAVLDCAKDCQGEHGAISGDCNGNQICICHWANDTRSPTTTMPSSVPLISIPKFPLQQCQQGPFAEFFTAFCNFDCQCQHGAKSGSCNWNASTCQCNYDAEETFDSIDNQCCPADTTASLLTVINTLASAAAAPLLPTIQIINSLISNLTPRC